MGSRDGTGSGVDNKFKAGIKLPMGAPGWVDNVTKGSPLCRTGLGPGTLTDCPVEL